jgi:PAS domain S-box-containing protein
MVTTADIRTASILIVDDKAANVSLLEQMLRGAGYESVATTTDPGGVCDLHRKNHYDLILLDLQMPGMDGFEVMESLKAIEKGGYLPVLVITAQPDHKLRALKAGAKDFISKPFDLAEVLARVHNMLEVRLLHLQGTDVNVARLENAQRLAGIGDWECDFTKNRRLRWSDEVYRILGISRGDSPPSAETFYIHVHPDELAAVRRVKKAAEKGMRRAEFEHRIVRPDGEVRHVRQIMEMTFDDLGQPSLESGTIQDITERKSSETALGDSEERYRTMLTLAPDSHFVHVDGVITFANQAFCELVGAADPLLLIGRTALEIFHPDYQEMVLEQRRIHAGKASIPPIELKFVRLDGTSVDVEVSSKVLDFHGREEVQVIARDITARKLAETALRESEERFKLLARAVSDVVWDWNLSTNKLWWNDGFLTTFGFGASEMEPSVESWTNRIHPDERDRVLKGIQNAVNSGAESWNAEYRFQRKDGTYAFVHDRAYIIRDASGKGVRAVGGMRDRTEQKKMEAQNLRSQRMESIGTLAGGIAHDLNNVLAPIMMAIELLKREVGDSERRAKMLDTIYASCRRGADLVRQVLSFARGIDHQRVAIRLPQLIDDLKAIITQTFPRNISITANVPETLWPITGDPSQLHQVLLNLAVNARDSMPLGGKLSITATNITIDAQFAAMSPGASPGPFVLLQVTDNGCGISPEARERIFEPFFTTKDVGKGTGLGLATVHSVVKNHGGFLNVDSEVRVGSTFKIYLPADLAIRPSVSNHPHDADLPRGRYELVLVIDDELSILEITQQTLEAFGYRVVTASNGAEAVALYAKQSADIAVVITDMMMPIMDGVATIHALTCMNPSVRIIAASGLELAENITKATGAGVHDFLQKPFTAETMIRRVREVIDRPASSNEFGSHILATYAFDEEPRR